MDQTLERESRMHLRELTECDAIHGGGEMFPANEPAEERCFRWIVMDVSREREFEKRRVREREREGEWVCLESM